MQERNAGSTPSASRPGRFASAASDPRLVLPALLFVGLALAAFEQRKKSLWLDELHSVYIASAGSWSELVGRVSVDFHPPLYFAWLHLLHGVDPHALRWLSVAAHLLVLVPLLALARAGGLGRGARAVVAACHLLAPFQIQYGTELRAYPVLTLATVTLAWGAFTSRATRAARFSAVAAATALGLYHHYFTAVAGLAVLGASLLLRPPGALRPRAVLAAGALGTLAFLPWVVLVEGWIFTDPGVLFRQESADPGVAEPRPVRTKPPILTRQNVLKSLASAPRAFAPSLGRLGPVLGPVARAAAAVLFLGVLVLGFLALRAGGAASPRPPPPEAATLRAALAAALIAHVLVLLACLLVWRRLSDQYFAVSAWAWALLLGAIVERLRGRARRVALALFPSSALVLAVCQVAGPPLEDTRAAVEIVRREAAARGALVTAALWQPEWYPDLLPYEVYGRDLEAVEPERIPPGDAPGARAVVLLTRRVNLEGARTLPRKLATIRAGRELERSYVVDDYVAVHVFVPRRRGS